MELEFDKYCLVDASPTTVLPPLRRRSKVEKRKSKRNSKCENDMLSLDVDDNFTEIRFHRYRSASCKNVSSATSCVEENASPRRGSVYQSSKEFRQMKKIDNVEGRKKIEISRSSAIDLSFGVVDSICSSDEDKKSSVMSPTARINDPRVEPNSRDFVKLSSRHVQEVSLYSDDKQNQRSLNGNCIRGRDPYVMLNKSLSAKLALPHSPARSESDSSRASSPRARFTPVRKMFDPFVKSKFHNSAVEFREEISNGVVGIDQNKAFRKSLLRDFSIAAHDSECDSSRVKKVNQDSPVQCSPAHLHGLLKLENKDGTPFFEFTVKFPEDMLVAKTWKAEDSSTWIYTFHSVQNKRKSNASGWGLRHSNKESSLIGQMQVSCHLCQEMKKSGLDKSMVTEFVLYDIARLRKSVSSHDISTSSPDVSKSSTSSRENSTTLDQCDHARSSGQFNPSASHPVAVGELTPDLESAVIVIQVPFEKRESLKLTSGDNIIEQPLRNLLDLSIGEQKKETKVNVVIPSGNHGLPTLESHGPAPLLDRWRLGGGCDCGGWDMACPLHIFSNASILNADDNRPLENQLPFELFVQGKKDNAPALTMRVTEDGHYAVDFHAQLSVLQAFSICISVLHTIEASSVVSKEKNKQSLQCDSLRMFVEEKIKYIIDAVIEEEKCKVDKKIEQVLPSFRVNPPFSPIARV